MTPRAIAARILPAPATVSPELRRSIEANALVPPELFQRVPANAAAWRAMATANNRLGLERLAVVRERFRPVIRSGEIAGVPVFEVVPAKVDPGRAHRRLVHLHGGAYVINGGEAGLTEAILAGAHARTPVISIDYRMPPDHPFPAAVEDAVAVWRALTETRDPRAMAVFGTSAGGGLALAVALKLKGLGLPMPAALAPGTPWADLSGASDSYAVNAVVDGVLPTYDGLLAACARLYAGEASLYDPLVSPVHGDFAGFPPTILTTGTRDILLSDTVRVHRRLRQAGVAARLEVHEAMSHAEYNQAFDSPESVAVFTDIADFLDRHLA
jgi:acetyl esterase/lipase